MDLTQARTKLCMASVCNKKLVNRTLLFNGRCSWKGVTAGCGDVWFAHECPDLVLRGYLTDGLSSSFVATSNGLRAHERNDDDHSAFKRSSRGGLQIDVFSCGYFSPSFCVCPFFVFLLHPSSSSSSSTAFVKRTVCSRFMFPCHAINVRYHRRRNESDSAIHHNGHHSAPLRLYLDLSNIDIQTRSSESFTLTPTQRISRK